MRKHWKTGWRSRRRYNKLRRALFAFLLFSAAPAFPRSVVIDFFYEEGCRECARVSEEMLPVLEGMYGGAYTLKRWNVGVATNYLRLATVMESFGETRNEPVFMLVDNRKLLAGYSEIADGLIPAFEAALHSDAPHDDGASLPEEDLLAARLESFTVVGVIAGGLLDGINPCAIATLVFLISVLSMSRTAGRHLLAVGAAFCLASFVTYTAIGLGLLQALRALAYFETLQETVEVLLILFLAALAILSFRDAARFKTSHKASDIALQLPERIRNRIHRMLRTRLGRRAQVLTAFGVGAGVTALESVCTGQVYLPTLALVVKSGTAVKRGLLYIMLYNFMFIIPLLVALWLTYRGMGTTRLMAWSRDNVVASKLLLGVFFSALAAAMAFLM